MRQNLQEALPNRGVWFGKLLVLGGRKISAILEIIPRSYLFAGAQGIRNRERGAGVSLGTAWLP